MRILGIDPGTGILGFGVVDVSTNGAIQLVDAGVIRTPVKEEDAVRLLTIYDELFANTNHRQCRSRNCFLRVMSPRQ